VLNGLFLDARIGVFLGCLLVAALRFDIPRARAAQVTILLVAAFGLKMVSVAQVWRAHDATYADFREAVQVITPGARVLSVHDVPGARAELTYDTQWSMGGMLSSHGTSRLFAERGMINLAVLERGAFVPSLFTYTSAQPLRSADQHLHIDPVFPARRVTTALFLAGIDPEASARLSARAAAHQEMPFWINWPAHFDFVVLQRYAYDPTPLPNVLVPVYTSAYFDIFQIRRADGWP
jgi:hypothetical protein